MGRGVSAIRFHVPHGAKRVTLDVFDQRGRRVRSLFGDAAAVGWQEAVWDGRNEAGRPMASGVYFARLDVDGVVMLEKMALVK